MQWAAYSQEKQQIRETSETQYKWVISLFCVVLFLSACVHTMQTLDALVWKLHKILTRSKQVCRNQYNCSCAKIRDTHFVFFLELEFFAMEEAKQRSDCGGEKGTIPSFDRASASVARSGCLCQMMSLALKLTLDLFVCFLLCRHGKLINV